MSGRTQLEHTLVILKPDAVQRQLVGRIVAQFESKGLKIVALKLARLERELLERHYGCTRARTSTSRFWLTWPPGRWC